MTEFALTAGQWRVMKEIVADALDLARSDREAFVRQSCSEQGVELEAVLNLLASEDAEGFSEGGAADPVVDGETRIGNYRVVRALGHGGMGTVYLAERESDYTQQVAIKVASADSVGESALRRFVRERQFLADLQHPSIVQVLDGGSREDGSPYLVMEYVEGQPITRYCQQAGLDLQARLRLFVELCQAVEFAHRHLVVHRDLKPANILVTEDGHPKLLDFGVAKHLDHQATAQTGTLALTPDYASPEQIRGGPITTATDVYSLGVIFYELIAGVRPYSLSERSYAEMVETICQLSPATPSAAVQKSPSTVCGAAWARKLQGDLDLITMKALRKEPERRYGSVSQFREDIVAYLEQKPVAARPDAWAYRAEKFLIRNRLWVTVGAVLLLSVLAGSAATFYEMMQARAQQRRAQQRFEDVHQMASSLLFDLHEQIRHLPGSTPVRKHLVEIAEQYLERLEKDAGNDPSLVADLADAYTETGNIQGNPRGPNLGDDKGAMVSYGKAIALYERLLAMPGVADEWKKKVKLATVYSRVADIYWQGDNPAYWGYYSKAEQMLSSVAAQHQDSPDLLHAVASSEDDMGDIYLEKKDYGNAEHYYLASLKAAEAYRAMAPGKLAAESDVSMVHFKLSEVYKGRKNWIPALSEAQKALSMRMDFAHKNPDNATAARQVARGYDGVAMVQDDMGDFAQAAENYQHAVDATTKLLKADPANDQFKTDLANEALQLKAARKKAAAAGK